jgi:hypothetical protein
MGENEKLKYSLEITGSGNVLPVAVCWQGSATAFFLPHSGCQDPQSLAEFMVLEVHGPPCLDVAVFSSEL